MKKYIALSLILLATPVFAYTKDPEKRTRNNNHDINWNIRDIIDDYVNFDYLNQNVEMRQKMYDELAAYINTLSEVKIDRVEPDEKVPNVDLEVTDQAVENSNVPSQI